jgi:hypothetical protein
LDATLVDVSSSAGQPAVVSRAVLCAGGQQEPVHCACARSRKNPHQRVNAKVNLHFGRKHGAPLTAYVTLLMG